MKRYMNDAAGMFAVPDGEWVRYADHVEAMKRIAGYGGQQEPICQACKGSGQIATGCDEFSESICKTCDGTGFAAPSASAQQQPVGGWAHALEEAERETLSMRYQRDAAIQRAEAAESAAPAPVASPAALTDAEQHTVSDLRSYARSIRMIEDNQGAANRDCIEAAEAMEWAALQIEGLRAMLAASHADPSMDALDAAKAVLAVTRATLDAMSITPPAAEGK